MRRFRFAASGAAFNQASRPIARAQRAAAACALALAAISGFTAGDKTTFPERPVRWVVPFPASGSIDLVARVLGPNLYATWGQQLVVDNRPGAGGRLGAQIATAAQPDGYTQLFSLNTTYTIDRSLFKHLNYDRDKALIPVTLVASTSQLLITNPAIPAGTPPAVVNKSYDAVTRALHTPEIVKQLLDLGAEPGGETPREFSRRIKAESAAWSQVFKKSNMQLD